MNLDPNSPAFPSDKACDSWQCRKPSPGLTIRAHFAAMAMQGLLASPDTTDATPNTVAKDSVILADALIAALNKEGK